VIDDYAGDGKADLLEKLSAREREVLQPSPKGAPARNRATAHAIAEDGGDLRARLVEKLGIRDVAASSSSRSSAVSCHWISARRHVLAWRIKPL